MSPSGLSAHEAESRLKEFGPNILPIQERKSAFSLLIEQFPSAINGLLFLASIFSFLFSDLIDGFFILATILFNGIFSFLQEYKAEKSLEKLNQISPQETRVLRDGKEHIIPVDNLVPGDIVILLEGDRIPADAVCLVASGLEINESTFTGESLPVDKKDKDLCYRGTFVTKGKATILIQKTGSQTRLGQLATTLSTLTSAKTPLERQLTNLGKLLTFLALFVGTLVISGGVFHQQQLTTVVLSGVSIAVAAVPEGLPLVLTVALALGTSRLAKKRALIRKMEAVETLGAIQVLLVDKTGTLTKNTMQVKKVWAKNKESIEKMHFASLLGNSASLVRHNGNDEIVGDKTDGAVLQWSKEQNPKAQDLLKQGKLLDEFVFDVKSKTITTIWSHNKETLVFSRGAPEEILSLCSLPKKDKDGLKKEYETLAKEGLRVIGYGFKSLRKYEKASRNEFERDLTFLGFLGIYDPPRKEITQVILQAKKAGIRTIMVTGDNELTAKHIGEEVGLLEKQGVIMTGEDFFKLTDEKTNHVLKDLQIMARAQPEDKLNLAILLQKQGFIVGVTGDGVNDALVLKKAHVGIAMGQSGTEVAKEASDIIITDDNFSTIIRAIEEGRTIYHNILKAIVYLITSNLSELSLVAFGSILNIPTVLLPTQILWINLVTDGFPALALATDSSSREVLKDPPRNTRLPLITKRLALVMGLGGVGLGIVLLVIYHFLLQHQTTVLARTIIFNLLVFSHLAMMLVIRGRTKSKIPFIFPLTIILTAILQMSISFLPFFQDVFHIGLN